jgi:hypothetical protein
LGQFGSNSILFLFYSTGSTLKIFTFAGIPPVSKGAWLFLSLLLLCTANNRAGYLHIGVFPAKTFDSFDG